MAVKLGSKVRDTVTGFEGIAAGRAEFMYGCARIQIEAQELKEGKPLEPQWFDEQRVVVVIEKAPSISADSLATSGGPQHDPQRSANKP